MRKALILIATVVLSGCSFYSGPERLVAFDTAVGKVDMKKSFFLAYPEDGKQLTFLSKEEINTASAEEVIDAFSSRFSKTFGTLATGKKGAGLENSFKEAQLRKDDYLVAFDITYWKDSPYLTCNPQNNKPPVEALLDKLDVTITVYNVADETIVNRQRVQSEGCPIVLLGFIPLGANSPTARFQKSLDVWYKNVTVFGK
ncbi:hypothetical protein RsTz2092_08120 [Deferribacterales bacterium RsTz2092]|nr:hypothetical protein AGMMS49941_08740 [Deferribacterales bacterium]